MDLLERDIGIENTDDVVRQALLAWLVQQKLEPTEPSSATHHHMELSAIESPEIAEAATLYAAAKSLHDSNMFSEGEQQARRALELRMLAFGAENIDTKAAKLLLASLLKKQKKLDEAIPLYQEMLAAARQATGVEHEETLACMNNLAVVLKQNGKLDDAQALYEETLHVKRIKFGVHHSSTLTSMSNLAGLLKAQGKYEEARVLYEESLQGHKSALGPDHPDTLTDMWNFALFLIKVLFTAVYTFPQCVTLVLQVNEADAAAALLRECYDGWQRILGNDHLNTIMCKKAMVQLGIQ
jgi:tetratricopeptide (TPR) repeat protein